MSPIMFILEQEPKIYIHPKDHETSIAFNIWKTTPFELELQPNKKIEVTVTNTKIEIHKDFCNSSLVDKDFMECSAAKMGQKIRDIEEWKKHCKRKHDLTFNELYLQVNQNNHNLFKTNQKLNDVNQCSALKIQVVFKLQ